MFTFSLLLYFTIGFFIKNNEAQTNLLGPMLQIKINKANFKKNTYSNGNCICTGANPCNSDCLMFLSIGVENKRVDIQFPISNSTNVTLGNSGLNKLFINMSIDLIEKSTSALIDQISMSTFSLFAGEVLTISENQTYGWNKILGIDITFQWVCPGYSGSNCINSCQLQNKYAQCNSVSGEITCLPGFINPPLCELAYCQKNVCENGAICVEEFNSARCVCDNGFGGTFCEINLS